MVAPIKQIPNELNIIPSIRCIVPDQAQAYKPVSVEKYSTTICSNRDFPRLSEASSLLDFHNTLGNDSVLQYVLHQYLNGSHWYSVISPVADSAPDKRRINSNRARSIILPFPCVLLGYDWRRSANNKGNRSSPLYAICLNWITFLQCVGFDSNYSFTDVTVQSNRTGNIPRQGSGLSCRLSHPEAGSLTRFTASIIKHLMLHRSGCRTRQLSVSVFGVPLRLCQGFTSLDRKPQ